MIRLDMPCIDFGINSRSLDVLMSKKKLYLFQRHTGSQCLRRRCMSKDVWSYRFCDLSINTHCQIPNYSLNGCNGDLSMRRFGGSE